jgi:rhodanese-related sulfurtransferase
MGVMLPTLVPAADQVKIISVHDLNAMLSDPEIIVLDVRTQGDWQQSKRKIQHAVREDPRNVNIWIHQYPSDKKLIFYCD